MPDATFAVEPTQLVLDFEADECASMPEANPQAVHEGQQQVADGQQEQHEPAQQQQHQQLDPQEKPNEQQQQPKQQQQPQQLSPTQRQQLQQEATPCHMAAEKGHAATGLQPRHRQPQDCLPVGAGMACEAAMALGEPGKDSCEQQQQVQQEDQQQQHTEVHGEGLCADARAPCAGAPAVASAAATGTAPTATTVEPAAVPAIAALPAVATSQPKDLEPAHPRATGSGAHSSDAAPPVPDASTSKAVAGSSAAAPVDGSGGPTTTSSSLLRVPQHLQHLQAVLGQPVPTPTSTTASGSYSGSESCSDLDGSSGMEMSMRMYEEMQQLSCKPAAAAPGGPSETQARREADMNAGVL